jgi:histidinol-phosphate aminotransferase
VTDLDLMHHGDAELDPDASGQLDLAVNVRLPRPPVWLRDRLAAALDELGRYPRQQDAVEAIAARHGRQPDEVLLTNGAAEAFTLLARALPGHHPTCVHPSFTEPETALRAAGRPVERVLLPPPFRLSPADVPEAADLVVLGNPTNPTGQLHSAATLEALARPGRYLAVDEAFADAVPGEPESLAARTDIPGLVVIRSLTKTWGLAGLRVGYVLADPATITSLRGAQPHWPVNTLALDALEACSTPSAVAWAAEQAEIHRGWRRSLARELGRLPGIEVLAGDAPFLLLRVPAGAELRSRLRELGVVVRRCDTFPGLGPDWLRIAVVAPEHHPRLLEAFRRGCAAQDSSAGDRTAS